VDFEGNSRSIEEIEVGDYVLARSEFDAAGPLELKRVEEKFVRVAPVLELVVRGQVITTTAEHPFFVAGEERLVPAGELTLEDQLVDSQGRPIAIDAIRVTDRLITVYNLRVADFHTYFVGGKLWQFDAWVHNASYAPSSVARPLTSSQYSNWMDVQLTKGTHFPGKGDGVHFREANTQLWQRMQADPDFARSIELEHPGITSFLTPGPRGGMPDGTPASVGLTWHHSAQREGILELVPIDHHRAPGPVQTTLHPNQQGGMELWGGGRKKRAK
jgi:hypothetical protein